MLIRTFKGNSKSIFFWESLVITLLLLNILGCSIQISTPWLSTNRVIVYSASSTIDALEEVRENFFQSTKIPVELNFGSTATLATQIMQGADVDLFLSADHIWADNLAFSQNIPVKKIKLLGNKLVVAVPKKAKYRIKSVEDILDRSYQILAVANPDAMVPAGIYTKEALNNLNLWEKLFPKLIYGENVRTVLHYIETESVQVGIIYRTDALASSLVRIELEIPSELHKDLQYHLLLLERGHKNEAAVNLFSYLNGQEARKIFKKRGFDFLSDSKINSENYE